MTVGVRHLKNITHRVWGEKTNALATYVKMGRYSLAIDEEEVQVLEERAKKEAKGKDFLNLSISRNRNL